MPDMISNFGGLRRLYTKPDIVCGGTAYNDTVINATAVLQRHKCITIIAYLLSIIYWYFAVNGHDGTDARTRTRSRIIIYSHG